MRAGALLALAIGACATRAPERDVPATRADVVAALYDQLELVIERYEEIAASDDPTDALEREELGDRAREIAMRIVRVDPHADVKALTARVEHLR